MALGMAQKSTRNGHSRIEAPTALRVQAFAGGKPRLQSSFTAATKVRKWATLTIDLPDATFVVLDLVSLGPQTRSIRRSSTPRAPPLPGKHGIIAYAALLRRRRRPPTMTTAFVIPKMSACWWWAPPVTLESLLSGS
jgi:hypothetical protein